MPTVRKLLLPLLLAMLVAACASQPRTPPAASHIRATEAPGEHDRLLASSSHAPHVVAAAVAAATPPEVRALVAGG